MNRFGLLAVLLATVALAAGCPQGPDAPAVDTGSGAAPVVPASDEPGPEPVEDSAVPPVADEPIAEPAEDAAAPPPADLDSPATGDPEAEADEPDSGAMGAAPLGTEPPTVDFPLDVEPSGEDSQSEKPIEGPALESPVAEKPAE